MNKRKYYCIEITKPKTAFAKSLSNRDWDGFFLTLIFRQMKYPNSINCVAEIIIASML